MTMWVNGLRLNLESVGVGRPLLLLHGFTGSAATWRPHLPRFARYRRTIAVDVIGHGRSAAPPDGERYRMERCVEDLLLLLDTLDVARFDLLGYSMGGRVALRLAVAAPERVAALILESASPGLANVAERDARVAADEALAASIGRDGLDAFVDRWERLPLFSSQAALPPRVRARLRRQRLQNTPLGLMNSLRGMGTGRQEPLWDRLPLLDIPTLLVVGELDETYRAIGRRMAAALPRADLAVVPGAGHAVHLEQPAAFAQAVRSFLTVREIEKTTRSTHGGGKPW